MNAGGWLSNFDNGSLHLSYNFTTHGHNFGAMYLIKGGTNLGGGWKEGEDGYLTHSLFLSYGLKHRQRFFQVSAMAGPTINGGKGDEDSAHPGEFLNAGLGANVQALFTLLPEIGIGFELMGNLNPHNSYAIGHVTASIIID